MFELLYTSVATKALSDSELVDILTKAQDKNQRLNITGMLIYHNREVMQLLEGDEQQVKDLYDTICHDHRHTSVSVFYQGEIETRAFADWSMAFSPLNEGALNFLLANEQELNHKPMSLSQLKDQLKDCSNKGKELFLLLREAL